LFTTVIYNNWNTRRLFILHFLNVYVTGVAVVVETWKRIWGIPTRESSSGKTWLSRTAERDKDYYIQVRATFTVQLQAL